MGDAGTQAPSILWLRHHGGHPSALCAAGGGGGAGPAWEPSLQLLHATPTHSPFEEGPVPTPGSGREKGWTWGQLRNVRRSRRVSQESRAQAEHRVCGDGGWGRGPGDGLGSRGVSQRTQDGSLPLFLCCAPFSPLLKALEEVSGRCRWGSQECNQPQGQ